MVMSKILAGMWLAGGMAAGTLSVCAQEFPTKPIRIITGTPGGGNDITSRQIGQGIAGVVGQQVIVENRPSALIAETVTKAPPDGYTLMVQGATVWLTPLLQKVNYDVVAGFTPLTLISRDVFVVVVHPSLPVKSVKELIDLAKARPGELNYSVGTPGGSTTLSGALLKSMTGVNMAGIPYSGPLITPVVSGEVHFTILEPGVVMPHVKSGRLRALAVTSAQPSALVPGMPTVSASGVPGYESVGMTGIFAPAKTPAAIVSRLNQEVVRFLSRPEIKEQFLHRGAEVVASTSEQFASVMKSDIEKWGKVIRDAGIKVN
jgi:tripartite-type tricarboxylate transporter receptor subunit TctC